MNHRGTYALLALFFAGLCGLWLADYAKLPTRLDRERLRSRILPALIEAKPDDLRKVEILGGEAPMAFERRPGNRWQMTTPMDVAADPSMVETLAFNLKELRRKPEADTIEGDPARFGLASPERTIRLWGASTGEPLATLYVGQLSLDRRYVRAGGSEGIEVVDARGLDLLRLPAVRWRDHELFRVPSFEVDAVRLANPRGEMRLRRDRDSWRIVAPFRSLAADLKVDGLIADLGSLRVLDDTRFIADGIRDADLDRYGLRTPRLTIEVEAGQAGIRRPPQSLRVGKAVDGNDGQVYARRGDQDEVLAVEVRALKALLDVGPNAFRSPKVADFTPARVSRIGFEGERRDFEVARSGRDWAITRPSAAPADRKAVEDFLKGLGELQTETYPDPATATDTGLDRPSLVISVWESPDPRRPPASGSVAPDGGRVLSLKIGRRDAAKRSIYAQLEGDPAILALPDSMAGIIPGNSLAFRDRLVLAIGPEAVEGLTLEGPGRKVTLRAPRIRLDSLPNVPMGWKLVEPVSAPAEAASVGRLLKLLSGLRAESLVAESVGRGDLKSFGLETPALTVRWTAPTSFSMVADPSSSGEHSLQIGSNVAGRPNLRFAKVADRPLIFTIGAEALGALDAEFHDHRVIAFDPGRVRKVHLAWPDRSFSMIPAGPGERREWSVEGAVDAPGFDPNRVGPLVKELSSLVTPRFLQYLGSIPAGTGLASPRLAIRVEPNEGEPATEVRVGNPVGNGQVFATTAVSGEGPVFLLPEALFSGWINPPRSSGDLPDDVFAR